MFSGPLLATLLLGVLPSLEQGVARYDALEYEASIVELRKAETQAVALEDRTRAQIYLGLSFAELAQWESAEVAFRNALALDPAAQLPIKSSPKIEKLFLELSAQTARAAREAARVADREAADAPRAPRALAAEPPLPDPSPAAEATRPAPFGPEVRPVVLLGGSLLAAGGGLAMGLASRASAETARGEPVQTAAAARADASWGQAMGADLLFLAATTLAVTAAVDYLLPSGKESK